MGTVKRAINLSFLSFMALASLCLGGIGSAQVPLDLDENCTITIGNQTAVVLPNGTFSVQNISIFQSRTTGIAPQLYRVRATCNIIGTTVTGQSGFLSLIPGQTVVVGDLFPSALDPIPVGITVTSPAQFLPQGGTAQLTVIARFADGSMEDVTLRSAGTTYLSTNPSLLTVMDDGRVTGVSNYTSPLTGTIAVLNEGNLGTIDITAVGPSNDFDNDGMPNDFEDLFGLNKFFNDANLDLDNDGLTNIEEFNGGTIPNNPDTDMDGILDGLDGDPLHPEESPPVLAITSPTDGGTLVEGQTILLTADASDDGLLTSVMLSADTGFSQSFTKPPFQAPFLVPVGANQIAFTATATDSVPNTAVAMVRVSVVPDPLTTVIGLVDDPDGNLVEGASLTTNGGLTGTTLADGTFVIFGVPTVAGDIVVRAEATLGGQRLSGASDAAGPVLGGITDVGTITIGLGRALVAQQSNGNVSLIEIPTLSELSTLSLGTDVIDVAVSPDGSSAVVTSFGAARMTFIDLLSDPPTVTGFVQIPFFAEDVDVTCTQSGFALVADGGGANQVISVDVANQSIVNSVILPVDAEGVATTPDGSLALVNAYFSDLVRVLGVSPSGVLTDTGISVPTGGGGPLNVAISPNGRLALVPHADFSGSAIVGVLSIGNGAVGFVKTVPLDGFDMQSIAFAPDGGRAYVYESEAGQVSVLDISPSDDVSDSGIRIQSVGFAPLYFGVDQLDVTTDGSSAVVHVQGGVTVFDTLSHAITGFIPLPSDFAAGGIAVIP